MTQLQETGRSIFKVSSRGQFSLPASARRRWGIEDGGEVEVFDLDGCVVLLPVGEGSARASLARALTGGRYRAYVESMTDPDLRDE